VVDQKFTLVDRRASNMRSEAKATLLSGPNTNTGPSGTRKTSPAPPVSQREDNDLPSNLQKQETGGKRFRGRGKMVPTFFLFTVLAFSFSFVLMNPPYTQHHPSSLFFPTLDILGRLLP